MTQGKAPTHTVGAAAARNALQDFVTKHSQQRAWGARATMVEDAQNPGKLGVQVHGDPGYFPVGTWAWLRHEGLDVAATDPALTPLATEPAGTGPHVHPYALPAQFTPPQLGEEVYVLWMDQGQQQPLVLGKIEWSH